MDVKELRIGNYVNHTDNEDTWLMEVITVSAEGCHTECNGIFDFIEPNLLEPIPLTEEWLVKFGFEIDFYGGQGNVTYYAKKGKFKLYSIEDDKSYQYDWTKNMFTMIKHVHQLQNLYYSLTQKELIWKKYI